MGEYKGVGVEGQRRGLESLKGAAGQVAIEAADGRSRRRTCRNWFTTCRTASGERGCAGCGRLDST